LDKKNKKIDKIKKEQKEKEENDVECTFSPRFSVKKKF